MRYIYLHFSDSWVSIFDVSRLDMYATRMDRM